MTTEQNNTYGEYIIIKAEESGVTISAVPFEDKENEYPVRLDDGELFVLHLDTRFRGYKIRGKVEVITKLGTLKGYSSLIVGS